MRDPKPISDSRAILVVNADDLGMSECVNRGILDAHTRGAVTSTSFMANMPGSEDGAARAAGAPGLDVGLHLNLTEGMPLTAARSLVQKDGTFRRLPAQLAALLTGRVKFDDLLDEARAQLSRARALGIRPTHLDGHEHVHVFGAARRAVFQIASAERLSLRRPRVSALPATARSAFGLVRNFLLRAGSSGVAWDSIPHPDAFFDVTSALPGLSPSDFVARLSRCRGVVEVMCHPGTREGADPRDALREHRPRDLEFLCSPVLRQELATAGIRLEGFNNALSRRGTHVGISPA